MPRPLEVVFVCTGNRARSPFAAALLSRLHGPEVIASSRGLLGEEGAPALREAVWAAEHFGVDLSSHRSRPLRPQALTSADLVIGFETQHVASAVVLGGAAKDRTFLISELAELCGEPSPLPREVRPAPANVIRRAHDERSRLALMARAISDPVGRSKAEFMATYEQISRMVVAIASGLFELDDDYGGSLGLSRRGP